MNLKEYLLEKIFKITADRAYPSEGLIYRHDTDPIDLKDRKIILRIRQDKIAGIDIDDCNSRQICEAFISAYMQAEKNLKENKAYEYLNTPSLMRIRAETEELDRLSGKRLLQKALELSIKIRELFITGRIKAELQQKEKQK